MTAIMTTGSNPLFLIPGLSNAFGLGYEEHMPVFDKIAEVKDSRRNFERDVLMSPLGLPQVKAQGSSVSYDAMKQGYYFDYEHVVYGLGIIITREEFEDDLYDVIGPERAKQLGRVFRVNKDIIVSNILNNGFSGGPTWGDGKVLFATDHPLGTGGTFANKPAVDANASEVAFENAVSDIKQNYVNDRGIKINVNIKRVIVSPSDMFNVQRILKSPLQNNTSNNAVNVLLGSGAIPEIVVNPYQTSTTQWTFITDVPNGIKLYERRKLEFTNDNDFNTENLMMKATERYSVGVTDPRQAYASSGS